MILRVILIVLFMCSSAIGGNVAMLGGGVAVSSTSSPAFIQQAIKDAYVSGTSSSISINSSTAGSVIIVTGGNPTDGFSLANVTDNASNTYTSYNSGAVWISTTGNSGATSVTVEVISAYQNWSVCLLEYGNVATTSPIDTYTSVNQQFYTSDPWTTGSVSTSFSHDMLVAVVNTNYASPTTAASGWTPRSNANNASYAQIAVLEKSVSSTGSYSATGDDSTYGNKQSCIFAIKGK